MPQVKLLLRCDECGFQFHHYQDKRDPAPVDCPECVAAGTVGKDEERERIEGEERIARMVESGIPPAMPTAKSKAMKVAEEMMTDFGMTNMNDSGRAGDIAAKAPTPPQTAEVEQMTRAMAEAGQFKNDAEADQFKKAAKSFWQPGHAQAQPEALKKHVERAPMAAAQARADGVDPVSLFHKAGKAGHLRRKPNIVAAVKG